MNARGVWGIRGGSASGPEAGQTKNMRLSKMSKGYPGLLVIWPPQRTLISMGVSCMIAWTISWLGNFNLPGKTAYLDNIHFLGRFKTYREKKT